MKSVLISSTCFVLLIVLLSGFVNAGQEGTIKWTYDGARVWDNGGTVAIHDNTIYGPRYYYSLFALDQTTGAQKWTAGPSGFFSKTSPVVASDGTIYQGIGSALYAFTPSGTIKWSVSLTVGWEGSLVTPPAIGSDGTLYVATGSTDVYAISPAGQILWTFPTNGGNFARPGENKATPVVGSDGTIYTRDTNSMLYAINPNGTKKWEKHIGDTWLAQRGSPAIGNDGTIYIGTDVDLEAIDPHDGTIKWRSTLNGFIVRNPVIDSDGTIYVSVGEGGGNRSLYAVNPDGAQKWVYHVSSGSYNIANTAPVVGKDGTIYVGLGIVNKYYTVTYVDLYAIKPDGTLAWHLANASPYQMSNPTLDEDGVLYFLDGYSRLNAINTTSIGLARSSWPKAQGRSLRSTSNISDGWPIVNQPPVANSQSLTTPEDTPISFNLTGSDSDGDPLTFSVVSSPLNGTLTGTSASRTYTPNANFNGSDSFTFKVNDGTTDSNIATVTITVTLVNDAPVLAPIGNKSVNEGQLLTFTITATDPCRWYIKKGHLWESQVHIYGKLKWTIMGN